MTSDWVNDAPRAETLRRKDEHLDLCLHEEVRGRDIGTGLDDYRFRHNALPELDFSMIDTSARFLGRRLKTPFMVSSMTGGTPRAGEINRRLAAAAQARGWAMGLGSLRAAIENADAAATFRVRTLAPDIPLVANIGAVQLNYGFDAEKCSQAIDIAEADGLVLHLNSLQEAIQTGGNTDFSGLLRQIEKVCRSLAVPVGVKEVGWGIDGTTARRLYDAGVQFIDVAGAGGTSWSQVEKLRSNDPVKKAAAERFAQWGIPTAECIQEVRAALPDVVLIGSGGLSDGHQASKALALGANLAGFGRSLLEAAHDSEDKLQRVLEQAELELRIAMFGIGAADIRALRETDRLVAAK
ncbi:type 2 isopentenyl-diphosphate Delta-isomerase [Cohnella rhizosphaerae]|uniref:Isopentenyl-diphosphate delta-isomerase n=1 Tax=Cohnella rhizosphaerae TaxID=1457232 RepID=A0A9X4KTU3_9BACL|nr:type 2 isopentenyl-diphosphate Delta-isomerase [Cohnella rhizosphaerae]MDG0810680.1 type 2 isopentenyl-diphosphate Delta-isomerase [Cohnella rhizosphaerae]